MPKASAFTKGCVAKTVFRLACAKGGDQNQGNLNRFDCLMYRHAFKMKLKPGAAAEYKRRHDEIWPELAAELRAAGVADYSIFLDEETLTLFAMQKLSDNNTAAALPCAAIVRKWWDYMAPLMEVQPDNAPVTKPLKEVFHLD